MKFSIEKTEIVQALDTAIRAVSSKSTLPILEGFLLEADGSSLYVTGNNLDIGIRYEAKADVLKPGKIVVNARLFSEVIKKMPDEEIDLTLKGNELTIEAGTINTKVATVEAKGYPDLDKARGELMLEIEQQDLKELITRTVFAVSIDENKGVFRGAYLNASDGQISMIGCDGFRFAIRHATYSGNSISAVIPGTTLNEISKTLKSGKMKIYKSGNIVTFETENFYVTGRTLDGEFINYKRLLPAEKEVTAVLNTRDLQSVLEMAMLFMPSSSDNSKNPPIKFNIAERFHVSYTSTVGQMSDVLKAEIEGNDLNIAFNPRFLLDAVRSIDEKQIRLEFSGALKPVIIKPLDSERFLHMATPVRI
jgi:DNA polymerase-3 subunit beta